MRPELHDDTPRTVSAISVGQPRQSCLVLKRLGKEKKQSVKFSENSYCRQFNESEFTDTIVPTQVTSKQYAYLVLMFNMIDSSFSPQEVFYLTKDPVTYSPNKYIIPLLVKDT